MGAVSGEARDTEQAGGPRLRVCSYLPRASCPLAAGWPLVLSHPRMPCPSWPHRPRGHPVAALPALPTPPPACSGPSVVLDSGSHPLSHMALALWEGEEPRGWPQLTVVYSGAGEGRPRRGLEFAPRHRVKWVPAGPGRLAVLTLVALCAGLAGLVVDCLVVEAGLTRTAHRVPGVVAAALHPITCHGRPGSELPTPQPGLPHSSPRPPLAGPPSHPRRGSRSPACPKSTRPTVPHHVTPSVGPCVP